jgi:hypothetical protein
LVSAFICLDFTEKICLDLMRTKFCFDLASASICLDLTEKICLDSTKKICLDLTRKICLELERERSFFDLLSDSVSFD